MEKRLFNGTQRSFWKSKIKLWLGGTAKMWTEIEKKYNLTNHCMFLRWIAHYREFTPNEFDGRWKNGPKTH